jgi:hypothetical protein
VVALGACGRTATDPANTTLTLSHWDRDDSKKAQLRFARPDADHLTLGGSFRGDRLEVHLRKIERRFRLRDETLRFFYDGPIESKR